MPPRPSTDRSAQRDSASVVIVQRHIRLRIAPTPHCLGAVGPSESCNSKCPNSEGKSDKPGLIISGERCEKTQKEKQSDCRARYLRPGAEPEQLLASTVLFKHRHSANAPQQSAADLQVPAIKISAPFYDCTLAKQSLSISASRASIDCHSSLQMACSCLRRSGPLSNPAQRQGPTP